MCSESVKTGISSTKILSRYGVLSQVVSIGQNWTSSLTRNLNWYANAALSFVDIALKNGIQTSNVTRLEASFRIISRLITLRNVQNAQYELRRMEVATICSVKTAKLTGVGDVGRKERMVIHATWYGRNTSTYFVEI